MAKQNFTITVDGETHDIRAEPDMPLLYALRNQLKKKGPKFGCGLAQCGACTVLIDGRRINSCLTLACMHDGQEITTIEGLGEPGNLSPLQAAFVRHDGYQCGYCTPGQICSATAMLKEAEQGWPSYVSDDLDGAPALDAEEISERMSGNLCRCGAYSNIVDAITQVVGERA